MPQADSLENVTEEQRLSLARAMQTLLNNPELARDTKKLLKKANPSLQFPDIDVEDKFEKFREEQGERDKKREEDDRVRRANENYEKLRGKVLEKGFTVEEVEKVMKDKGIANYDTAMEYIEAQRQLAPPTPDSIMTMEMPANMNEMNAMGLKKFRLNTMNTVLNEIRAGKRV